MFARLPRRVGGGPQSQFRPAWCLACPDLAPARPFRPAYCGPDPPDLACQFRLCPACFGPPPPPLRPARLLQSAPCDRWDPPGRQSRASSGPAPRSAWPPPIHRLYTAFTPPLHRLYTAFTPHLHRLHTAIQISIVTRLRRPGRRLDLATRKGRVAAPPRARTGNPPARARSSARTRARLGGVSSAHATLRARTG
jgi:hypothetical protein